MNPEEAIKKGLFHSIHNSERKYFNCKRAWSWRYRDGYLPKTISPALEFGTAWHAGLEVWYEPSAWTRDRTRQLKLAKMRFLEVTDEQLANYIDHNGIPYDSVLEERNQARELGLNMMDYYCLKISPELDANLKPFATETLFEIPLDILCRCDNCWNKWIDTEEYRQDIAHCVSLGLPEARYKEFGWLGLPVTYGGTIDIIMIDNEGRVLIGDWKTANKLLKEEDFPWLDLDTQVGGYCAALYKMGNQCDGFFYHEQRKAVPTNPRLLDRAYKGRKVSTSKEALVDYAETVRFIKKHDLEGWNKGLYKDYMWYLRSDESPKFYQRIPVYKTNIQLENFWNNMVLEVKDILAVEQPYPEAERFRCLRCSYRIPCDMQDRGEDYQFMLDNSFLRS